MSFNIGDKVYLELNTGMGDVYAIDTVANITPGGNIRLTKYNNSLYNKDGREKTQSYHPNHFQLLTPELLSKYNLWYRRRVVTNYTLSTLSDEQIERIFQIIKEPK